MPRQLLSPLCAGALSLITGLAAAQSEAPEGSPPADLPAGPADPPRAGGSPEPEEPVVPPVLKTFVKADYPERAAAAGIEATVVLEIDIDVAGQVEGVTVVGAAVPAGYGFDEAAVRAVNLFEFEPARVGDQAIPVRIVYRYNFTLEKAPAPAPAAAEPELPPDPIVNFRGRLVERGTRAPIAGVTMTVFRGEGNEALGFEAVTDANGWFELYDLEPGSWSLLADPEGYFPLRTVEAVVAGELTEATYFVERGSYSPFDVLVRAERPRKEVSRTTLTIEEVDKVPGGFGDVLAVVQNLPSVARAQLGTGAIVVRGSAPEDTQVFVDGVSVPLIYHFGGLRSVIPVGMLERLDFYPGNFSVYYGRATGGILDVGLKRLAPEGVGGYVDVNLFDAGAYLEVPVSDELSFAIAGRRSYIDTVLNAAVPDDAPVSLVTAPRYYDFQALASYRPTPANDFRAFFLYSDDRLELLFNNPGNLSADFPAAGLEASTRFYRTLLDYRYVPSETFENEVKAAAGRNWIRAVLGKDFVFDLNFYVAQIRETARWTLGEALTLRAGADYLFTKSDALIRLPQVAREGELGGRPDLTTVQFTEADGEISHGLAAFLEGEITPVDGLLLVPGIRFDHFTRLGDSSVAPRVGARYRIGDQWTAKAGVGLFHQEPAFDETDAVFGNPDLGLESAIHYSAGAEVKPLGYLTLDATLFYKDLRDLVTRSRAVVEREGDSVPEVYNNDGRGRVYGAELLIRHELANNFFGWLSYTLSRAERLDGGEDQYRLFDFDQTHILTLLGSYRLPYNWEVGVRWRLVSGNPYTRIVGGTYDSDADLYEPVAGGANRARLPPFHQLDLRIDKRWVFESWMMTAYLDIQNVYNRANAEELDYNYNYSQSAPEAGLPILTVFGIRAEL